MVITRSTWSNYSGRKFGDRKFSAFENIIHSSRTGTCIWLLLTIKTLGLQECWHIEADMPSLNIHSHKILVMPIQISTPLYYKLALASVTFLIKLFLAGLPTLNILVIYTVSLNTKYSFFHRFLLPFPIALQLSITLLSLYKKRLSLPCGYSKKSWALEKGPEHRHTVYTVSSTSHLHNYEKQIFGFFNK